MPRPVSTGYIRELDGLRGLAILLVMVHRLYPRALDMPAYVEDGWIGVDLFFVVSGFLITGILLDTRGDPDYFRNFYARRVLRIFPLFYLFIGGMLLAFPLTNPHFIQQAGSPLWYLLQVGNLPEAVLRKDPPYWIAPVWSLAIEEQFYLTFPLLVRKVDPRRLGYWLAGLATVAIATRVITVLALPSYDRLQYQFTLCRLDAIAAGAAVALLVRSREVPRRLLDAVLLATLAIAVVTELDRTTLFGRTAGYSVVALGFAALVLRVLGGRGARWTTPLRFGPLCYLGKLCFGLYLLHRPADTLVVTALHRVGIPAANIVWVPVKIAVAVGLASLSWFALEKPFLRFKRLFVSSRHPVAAAALATLLCACHVPGHVAPPPPDSRPDSHAVDASMIAVDASHDAPADGDVPSAGRILYPEGHLQSPITSDVVDAVRSIAAQAAEHNAVFAKVGDSITASESFFDCFGSPGYDLAGHGDLASTITFFESSFARTSLAATGGWTTADELSGSPCPLEQEVAAITPRVAVVMLGTNDDRYGRSVDDYGSDLWTIVDDLRAKGVVPILSTIPPMFSDPGSDARVPLFNRVIRALAQGRSLPLVDFHDALLALPQDGISSDGLHPTSDPSGDCALDAQGLQYGYPVRNLVTLEALDRTRSALANVSLDASAPRWTGTGTRADPLRGEFPLVDLGDTRSGEALRAGGCGLSDPGHEVTYRVDLTAQTTLDAYVVDRGAVDVDVAISDGAHCLAAGDQSATATAGPGTVYVVVDSHALTTEGEYLLVVEPH